MRRGAIRLAIAAFWALAVSACSSGGSSGSPTTVTVTSASPSSGTTLGGTAVVISGTNFESGATVQFGTAQASFVGFNSSTSLSVSTPPGEPGPVNVTVTNPDATTGELVNGFTFVAPGCTLPAAVSSSLTLDAGCVWSVPVTAVVEGPNNPVLTVPPGTTVEFANGTALVVGLSEPGSLVAQGTSSAGITFTSAATSPVAGNWGGIVIGPQSSAAVDAGTIIAFATINFAGGAGANGISETAALTVEGGEIAGGTTSPAPVLANLSIQNSAGHGLVFAGVDTGFGMGSGSITVSNWEMTTHYPFVIEANQGGTIPTSISAPATPPSPNAVVAFTSYVNPGYCDIVTSQTWPSLPLPILCLASLELGAFGGSAAATVTISTPNRFEFIPNTELDIDPAAMGLGFLVADGAPGNPLVFTSTDGGAWGGLNFAAGGQPDVGQSPSSLTYAVIEYANNPIPNGPPGYGTGSITVANQLGYGSSVLGPTIANCQIENYPSYGITMFNIYTSSYSNYTGGTNSFSTPAPVLLPDGGPGGAVSSYCYQDPNPCTDTGPGP